jgi:predicted ferric reductase
MHLPVRLDVKPGTHAYLRFGGINAWECHPFSIAWVDHISKDGILPLTEKEMDIKIRKTDTVTDVSFIIQAQKGLTRRLYNKANEVSPRVWTVKASLEGPYAGHHSLDSYGHAILIAGASGITHQLPYVRHLVNGYHHNTVATRKVVLIWIVRDAEQLEWVRPWMDKILCMPGRREVLTIKLFITRPKNPREITSPSATVMMYPGRPNIKTLIATEVQNQFGAMAVTVCGPGGLQDNVREAVRDVQEDGVVDYIEESFT